MNREQLEQARRLRCPSPQNFMPNRWFRIGNVAADTAEVYLYDEIGYFGITADDFIREVTAVRADKLTLRVSSRGGDVFEALAIHAFIAEHGGVTAIVDSVAASAASFLIAGAQKVQVQRNASLMVHDASLLVHGNEEAIRAAADLVAMASDNIADIYSQRTPDTSAEQWREVMKSGDRWYSSTQALEAGLVDEVLDNSKKSTDAEPEPEPVEDSTEDDELVALLGDLDLAAVMKAAFSKEEAA